MAVPTSVPTADSFAEELVKEPKWYDLGVFLGAASHELDSIECRYASHHGVTRCLIELHKCLIRSDKQKLYTWECVTTALTRMGNIRLANHIKQKYVEDHTKEENAPKRSKVDSEDTRVEQECGEQPLPVIEKQLMTRFESVLAMFTMLLLSVKDAFTKEKLDVKRLQFFLQEMCGIAPPHSDEDNTLDVIFLKLQPHYSFLSYNIINLMVDNFISEKEPLKKEIKLYDEQLEGFKASSTMQDLIQCSATSIQHFTGSDKPGTEQIEVKLKLRYFWSKVTIRKFEILTKLLFEEVKACNRPVLVNVQVGCICVRWFIQAQFIDCCISNVKNLFFQAAKFLGIISISIYDFKLINDSNIDCELLPTTILKAVESKKIRALEILLAVNNLNAGFEIEFTSFELCSICNVQNQHNLFCLHYASYFGHVDVVIFLLSNGSRVSIKGKYGVTPLTLVCAKGYLDIAQILIHAKADVNLTTDNGETPIYFASLHGYYQIVRTLLNNGANPETVSNNEMSPLMVASVKGHKDIVDALLQVEPPVLVNRQTSTQGLTALYQATIHGHVSIIKALLKANADPNLSHKHKKISPLMIACMSNYPYVVELLLEAGADPHVEAANGHTALYYALNAGSSQIVQILLDYGANSNELFHDLPFLSKFGTDWTCLMIACVHGHIEVVRQLVMLKNSNPNHVSTNGMSTLHLAAMFGHFEITKLLIKSCPEININAIDSFGETARSYASMYNHTEIVQLIDESQMSRLTETYPSLVSMSTDDECHYYSSDTGVSDLDSSDYSVSFESSLVVSETYDNTSCMSILTGLSDD